MYHPGTFSVHRFSTFWIFQAGNTVITLVGKLQGKPWTIHSKTPQEHSLGTFRMFPKFSLLGHSNHMTQDISNVLNIPHPGKLQRNWLGKFRMCFQCTKWVHCDYFVHFLAMYLQCSSSGHQILPPVTEVSAANEVLPINEQRYSLTVAALRGFQWKSEVWEEESGLICRWFPRKLWLYACTRAR